MFTNFVINKKLALLLVLFCTVSGLRCNSKKVARIEYINLKSKIFENNRTLRVYLPKEYDGKRSFKVLYLNDGQNLFGDNNRGAEMEWRVDEIVDSLIEYNKMEPLIIVGIDYAENKRADEYLPWADIYLEPPVMDPHGKEYPDFLTNEVMPLFENNYKVLPGRKNTGIGGSSYGGLMAIYALIMKPDHFGFALIESPSLYVDNQRILKLADSSFSTWECRIYLGIGTNELGLATCDPENQDNKMAIDDVIHLGMIIKESSPANNVFIKIDSCAIHNERAWSGRLPVALEFLFKRGTN